MIKTIKLDEDKFLLIEYFPRPRADEEEVYNAEPSRQFPCRTYIESVKLMKREGITDFNPKEFHKMAKEFMKLKDNEIVMSAEDLRV